MMPLTSLRRYGPPLVLATLTLVFVGLALGFPKSSRSVPLLAGSTMLVLLVLDLASRATGTVGTAIRQALNPDCAESAGEVENEPIGPEIVAILTICGFVALVMLIGFHLAIPVYLLVSMLVRGGIAPLKAALITLAFSGGVYLLFELGLSFRLYGGVLLS